MAMKKILIYTVVLIAMSVTSCDDLLVEEPRSFVAPDQFFNTVEECEGALFGVKSFMANYEIAEKWYLLRSELGTDVALMRELPHWTMQNYELEVEYSYLVDIWRAHYTAIGNANMLVSRMADSPINETDKNRIIAEAKFFRAFYYFRLSRYWGDVPLWTDELDVDAVSTMGRTPLQEVRAQVIKDLSEAEDILPESVGSQTGRPTKWAAKSLLAKVYLFEEDWQNAKNKAGEVIQNSGHRLLIDYNDIFDVENEFNDEIIYTVDFIRDIRGSNVHTNASPRPKDEPAFPGGAGYYYNGWGMFTVMPSYCESFADGDSRKHMSNYSQIETQIDGKDTIIPLNLIYFYKWNDFGAPKNNGDRNTIILRYADVLLIYAEAENNLTGPTSEAHDKINLVRRRAFGDQDHNLAGLSKEQFQQAIMDERKWELGGEGHRRWDLVRWGKLVEAVQSAAADNPIGAANVKPHHVLFPVPLIEIQKNPNLLPNNPGYE